MKLKCVQNISAFLLLQVRRWSKLKAEWKPRTSFQALVCSILPSYWDIASDVSSWVCVWLNLMITDLAWCHLPHCDLWQWILPNWGAWFLLGQVNIERRPKSKLPSLLCSAWPLYWCSYLEPSCSATVWRASGWGRSGGGGGRLPAYSSPSRWFALKWVQQMSFSILSFLKQATLLLSQSQRMVGMNIRITACEAAFESLLQLSLQL